MNLYTISGVNQCIYVNKFKQFKTKKKTLNIKDTMFLQRFVNNSHFLNVLLQ